MKRLTVLLVLLLVPALAFSINDTSKGIHIYTLEDVLLFNETKLQVINISLPENATVINAVVNLIGKKDGPHLFNRNITQGEFKFGSKYGVHPKCAQTYQECRVGGCESICSYYEEEKSLSNLIELLGENRTNCLCKLDYYLEQKCSAELLNGVHLLPCSTSSSICLSGECVANGVSCEHRTGDIPDSFTESIHGNETFNCTCEQDLELIQSIYVYQDSYDWNLGSAGTKFENSTLDLEYQYYSYPQDLVLRLGEIEAGKLEYLNDSVSVNVTEKMISGSNLLNFEVSEIGGYTLVNLSIEYVIVPKYPVTNVSFEVEKEKLLSFEVEPET